MNSSCFSAIQEMCVDFHTHILPQMDDGSPSAEESLRMLRDSRRDGVSCVVLTPHFLAERESPERFFARRERSLNILRQAWNLPEPLLIPGAEVAYFDGISSMRALEQMCPGHSHCLLLEMPFCPWTERMLSEVTSLSERQGYHVVLAHVERYLRFQKSDVLDRLIGCGVRMQSNAGFFVRWQTRRNALRMLRDGRIHLLGSDCHNMDVRPPNLGAACRILREKGREDALRTIMARGYWLLELSRAETFPGREAGI